jgi:hypothetical protein
MVISHHIIRAHANERVAALRSEPAARPARPDREAQRVSRSRRRRRRAYRAHILGLRRVGQ